VACKCFPSQSSGAWRTAREEKEESKEEFVPLSVRLSACLSVCLSVAVREKKKKKKKRGSRKFVENVQLEVRAFSSQQSISCLSRFFTEKRHRGGRIDQEEGGGGKRRGKRVGKVLLSGVPA
jgi:hypothetical protein